MNQTRAVRTAFTAPTRLLGKAAGVLFVAAVGCHGAEGTADSLGGAGGDASAASSGASGATASGGALQSSLGQSSGGKQVKASVGSSAPAGQQRGGASSTNSMLGNGSTLSDATLQGGSSGNSTRPLPINGGAGAVTAMTGHSGTSGVGGSGPGAQGGTSSSGKVTTGTGGVNSSSAQTKTSGMGGTSQPSSTSGPQSKVVIYLAGDSTVSSYTDTAADNDQAGWGQMLGAFFNSNVSIVNRAAGGRTAYWFYLEGALESILSKMNTGDYLFIQFGTNDQNKTATFTVDGKTYPRLAEPETFKTQLKQYYLDPTKAKGGIPVLVTPPPRNSAYCNGGNGLGAYATAMRELGAAESVVVLDNNASTYAYLKAICPQPSSAAQETFFFGKADGSIDGTHFQENGARTMAGFIAEAIDASSLGLKAYLR